MPPQPDETLPIAAPCRAVVWSAPLTWVRLGFADVRRAPRASLFYGLVMLVLSYAMTAAAWYFGRVGIYIGVMSGLVFLGPVLALRLYVISYRLERGQPVGFAQTFRDAAGAFGDVMVFALVLLVVALVWARAATMVHVFFPIGGDADLLGWLRFLGIGSAIGALFCSVIFMASAFSLPMLMDKRCDTVTAIVSSVNAALRNKAAMLCWALCILALMLVGMATAYLALVVILPALGHAAWHGYRATLDTQAWPDRLS